MKNVIPAKAGIQKTKELDSCLHGNDGREVFSDENRRLIICLTGIRLFCMLNILKMNSI